MGKKNWLLTIGLVSVLAIFLLGGCSPAGRVSGEALSAGIAGINISGQQQGISVSGRGEVTVTPDIAMLRLGIEAEETSVAQAQTQATEAMDRVMTALTKNGVAKKDIQTQYFSIRRVTKWDRVKEQEVVTGYRVTNMVTAKIRDIDETGVIIDAVAEAGGSLTRIDNISFSVDDPSDYHEEARQEAMADAEAKAKQLAELAGITLGKPIFISEGSQVPSPIYQPGIAFAEERAMAAETSISPGEMEISLTVQVVYAIRN